MKRMLRNRIGGAMLVCAAWFGSAAAAEVEFSIYGGVQSGRESDMTVHEAGGDSDTFRADWEGRPFSGAPYYGVRLTWWRDAAWGASLDFAHAKIYADDPTLARGGFDRLSFTHGLNILTANLLRRFPLDGALTPYVGVGIGITAPHVEVSPSGSAVETLGYQFGGLALRGQAGLAYAIGRRWTLFGEYKLNWVRLRAELDGGNKVETDVLADAVNLGIAYRF